MLSEKLFEEIICRYPELIEENLNLKARQATLYGRRIDLLFEDKFKRKLLIELKAGPIKDQHIGQILSYEGMILSADDPSIRVMLVGNRVPPNIQRSLDHHGIAWKELQITFLTEFLRERNDLTLLQCLAGEQALTIQDSPTRNLAQPHSYPEKSMPRKGDIFKGKVNDLFHPPAKGWRSRDIWFFKHEVTREEKFEYPIKGNKILLIDTDGDQYELNFSKPDLDHKVCLGTPTRLKPWYLKKGFDALKVDPDTWVYFKYTGPGNEFYILTEEEYRSKYNKGTD